MKINHVFIEKKREYALFIFAYDTKEKEHQNS
jgi:hypothetical protein